MYKWNSNCNCFEPYETEYETYTDENGEEQQREIAPTVTVYTQEEVDTILASRGENQVIKDVGGRPRAVDFYSQTEIEKNAAAAELAEVQAWFTANDWKVNKIVVGEWATDDTRWTEYCAERAVKRARQDVLNGIIG